MLHFSGKLQPVVTHPHCSNNYSSVKKDVTELIQECLAWRHLTAFRKRVKCFLWVTWRKKPFCRLTKLCGRTTEHLPQPSLRSQSTPNASQGKGATPGAFCWGQLVELWSWLAAGPHWGRGAANCHCLSWGHPSSSDPHGQTSFPTDLPTPPDVFVSHFLGQRALNPSWCRSDRWPEWGRAAHVAQPPLWARSISPWFSFRRSIRKAISPGQSCLMQCHCSSSSGYCLSFPTPPFQLQGPSLKALLEPWGCGTLCAVGERGGCPCVPHGLCFPATQLKPSSFTGFNGICHSLTMNTSGSLGWALPAALIQLSVWWAQLSDIYKSLSSLLRIFVLVLPISHINWLITVLGLLFSKRILITQ